MERKFNRIVQVDADFLNDKEYKFLEIPMLVLRILMNGSFEIFYEEILKGYFSSFFNSNEMRVQTKRDQLFPFDWKTKHHSWNVYK